MYINHYNNNNLNERQMKYNNAGAWAEAVSIYIWVLPPTSQEIKTLYSLLDGAFLLFSHWESFVSFEVHSYFILVSFKKSCSSLS